MLFCQPKLAQPEAGWVVGGGEGGGGTNCQAVWKYKGNKSDTRLCAERELVPSEPLFTPSCTAQADATACKHTCMNTTTPIQPNTQV